MRAIKAFLTRPWLTILSLHIHTLFGKPYFKVFFVRADGNGGVGVDAHHNIHFIYELDNYYARAGAEHYDRNMEEQAKVSIYLYDTMTNLAEHYLPLDQEVQDVIDEMNEDAPPLAFRGGEEIRQVVDLANEGGSSNLGFSSG